MTKKRTKKAGSKKTGTKKALKKRASNPRKGSKRPYKSHGSSGVGRSLALAKKAKRERNAKNAKASAKALKTAAKKQFDAIVIPAGVVVPSISAAPAAPAGKPKKKRAKKAASASSAPASKKAGKKGGKKRGKKVKKAVAAPAAAAPKKKARKVGSASKARKAVTEKFKLMHQWGFPSRRPLTSPKRKALRDAAGDVVTFKKVMDTIQAEKLKSWVCVGPRRTGCGGGAKNLRGGHQVGIFTSGYAR
jgi:hypothetical protein